MKKILLVLGVLAVLLLAGCAKEPRLGESCGTVTPGYNDDCCQRVMMEKELNGEIAVIPACVHHWEWDEVNAECKFVCTGEQDVYDFASCVAAGYPIMESYPEQCTDGINTFVAKRKPIEREEIDEIDKNILTEQECKANFGELVDNHFCADGAEEIGIAKVGARYQLCCSYADFF